MATVEVKVPDIGDFDEVAVIEVLVKVGDTVKPEQSLITVESDKASMEIPSSAAGVVKELKVGVGSKVKEGSVVLVLEGEGAAAAPAPAGAGAAAAGACRCCARTGTRCRGAPGDGTGRGQGARHRRLQGRRCHRGAGETGRYDQGRAVAHHGRVGQGLDGDPVFGGRRAEGAQGQGRRHG